MSIEQTVQAFVASMLAGDFEAALARFSIPAVIYVDGHATVFATRDALARGMEQYVGILRAEGAASVAVRVVAKSATRGPAHSAWLECSYRDAAGRQVALSDVRYYYTRVDDTLTVSMLEYRRLPLEDKMRRIPALKGLGSGQVQVRSGSRDGGPGGPGRRLQ
jgi:hypothetical protein